MLLPEIAAAASARAAATYASSSRPTWEMRRSRIPVRLTIQSSLVSSRLERSWLLSTAGGRHLPQPVMAAWITLTPPSCCVRIAAVRARRSGERLCVAYVADEIYDAVGGGLASGA